MRWLGNIFGRRVPAENSPDGASQATIEDDPHYKAGQRVAAGMVQSLDEFFAVHFAGFEDGALRVLRLALLEAMRQEENSPIIAARWAYGAYLTSLVTSEEEMKDKSKIVMQRWSDALAGTAMAGEVDYAIERYVSRIGADLRLSGLKMTVDFADALKAVDDSWRRRNPVRAAQQPLE